MVNFTGYAVNNGNDTWFHNRSIDNSSLTYYIESGLEFFRVEFETVDYWRYWDWDYVSCSTVKDSLSRDSCF